MNAIDDDTADLLGAEGPFAREVVGFAPRAAQQAMAAAVTRAIAQGETLIVEAGTGTGKTFAYLVPALASGQRVIVSTGTRALQDQLFFRDLPRVRGVLGSHIRTSLLKGRSNYLCLYRLNQAVHSGRIKGSGQAQQLAAIRAWSARTRRGDRMELAAVPEDAPIWREATSTPDNCLGSECPFYDECYVYQARREAQQADVLVINHHLLFADMALREEGFGEVLPSADVFILDEAHQLPELAGRFFSQDVSARQLRELGRDVLGECAGISGALDVLREPVAELDTASRRLRLAMEKVPARGALVQLVAHTEVRDELDGLIAILANLVAALTTQAERSRGLANVHARAQALASRLARIDGEANDEQVRWYEHSRHGFALHMTPLTLAAPLGRMREAQPAARIYTSATLSVAGRFEHFARQMGLEDPRTLALESPFDYATQALCYLPHGLPAPGMRDYTERMVAAILPVLEASRGRAFLLFTSHRALKRAAELLREQAPWPLFVQGEAPRHQLLDAFRESGHGVLLGAASFWQGVDVAGQALSVVAIDKLPFASPDDPVLQARLSALAQAGENPFMAWQVPNAAIALKQGVGRLIRDIHDRGVLVLCDPRLTSKGYGRLFFASLPPMPRTCELADVQAFFARLDDTG
jgi:ATP-dependent DNA helicase DinG